MYPPRVISVTCAPSAVRYTPRAPGTPPAALPHIVSISNASSASGSSSALYVMSLSSNSSSNARARTISTSGSFIHTCRIFQRPALSYSSQKPQFVEWYVLSKSQPWSAAVQPPHNTSTHNSPPPAGHGT